MCEWSFSDRSENCSPTHARQHGAKINLVPEVRRGDMGSAASQARAGSFISKLAFHLAEVTASQHHLAVPLSVTDLSKPVKLGAARTLAASLSRCGSDSWLKLWKLGVRSDVGLGLSLCAVPLLQFGPRGRKRLGRSVGARW